MFEKNDFIITPQMLAIIAELDEFKGSWREPIATQLHMQSLKKVSTVESIGSSNRIEGNTLSNEEVEEFLSRMHKTPFASRDEEEVAGYADLMDTIFNDYPVFPFTENHIKQLHQILLQYTGKDEKHRGEYKKLPNSVAAFDPSGKEIGIVFETASPFDTPRLMEELVGWARTNLDDPLLHPLIGIGIFIVRFLAIHPFEDGNGRLSRALTTMLLLQKGYAYVPFSSLESIVEANKEGYYRALRETQKDMWASAENYEPWLVFFLTCLQKQKRLLEGKLAALPGRASVSRNQKIILDLFDAAPELTSPEIAARLGMNMETVKKNLKALADAGYLIKHGATKGAWYAKRG
jgi:Fic family protein